ncbi:MAG TPA: hypothetical protein VFB90_09475 [Dehalococcoidia bacterium]|nr:hypothetical protein [Dehalococcoidia bacterium]
MREPEALREREAEPQVSNYEEGLKRNAQLREKLANSPVVLKPSPLDDSRQGKLQYILLGDYYDQGRSCVPYWNMFTSGQHRHQGGLGLFAIEGEGYTVVDGPYMELTGAAFEQR